MILITGATGFIGTHVLKRFLKSVESDKIQILEHKRGFKQEYPDIHHVLGDITEKSTIEKAVKNVDAVIHLASKNLDKDNTGFEKTNIEATKLLCDAACKAGVEKFIYLSSVGVYGHKKLIDADETEAVSPDTAFSGSKAAAEKIILEHNSAGHFKGIILRHRFVYGKGDVHVIARMVKAAQKYKFMLNGGKAKMSFVSADDLAEVIFRFVYADNISSVPIYHITDGIPVSYRELIFKICDTYGFKKPKFSIPMGLIYPVIKLAEGIRGIDPESTRSSLSSIRLKLIGTDNHFSNKKLLTQFPDLTFKPLMQNFENFAEYYSQFK